MFELQTSNKNPNCASLYTLSLCLVYLVTLDSLMIPHIQMARYAFSVLKSLAESCIHHHLVKLKMFFTLAVWKRYRFELCMASHCCLYVCLYKWWNNQMNSYACAFFKDGILCTQMFVSHVHTKISSWCAFFEDGTLFYTHTHPLSLSILACMLHAWTHLQTSMLHICISILACMNTYSDIHAYLNLHACYIHEQICRHPCYYIHA